MIRYDNILNNTKYTAYYNKIICCCLIPYHSSILSDGSLSVGPVDDKTYTGNYTCYVENIFGRDQISYMLNMLHPPSPPEFHVDPISTGAILVQWKPVKQSDAVTTGYVLTYRTGDEPPHRIDVDSDRFTYMVDRLKCGSKYAVTMQTVNTVGTSSVSRVEEVFTKGGGKLSLLK